MEIHESGENYLEAILMIKLEKGLVRSIDIAQHLQFSKPSISRAMSILRSKGLIVMDIDGFIELTDTGLEIAETIYERHKFLTRYLILLGVSPEISAQDACRMEHVISVESFQRIKEHIAKYI